MHVWITPVLMFTKLLEICSGNPRNDDDITSKIVGGTPTAIDKFPSNVQLYNQGSLCGGVILNSWTILTAAHCVLFNTNINFIIVQVGARYLYGIDGVQHSVVAIDIHDDYNHETFDNDIALLFLGEPIKFGRKVKRAVLVDHEQWRNPKYTKFHVAGWGKTKYTGEISPGLLETQLQYTSNDLCEKMFKRVQIDHRCTKSMFCLYGNGTKDACQGDSGSGVYWKNYLVGLVSHGDSCGETFTPSVYTNVYYMSDWIEQRVEAYFNYYCEESI